MPAPKAQSATEFIISYSWAFLIITIIIAVLFTFVALPRNIVPSQCVSYGGFVCSDSSLVTSTSGSNVIILISDSQEGVIAIQAFNVIVDNQYVYGGTCTPNTISNGEYSYCIATSTFAPALAQAYSGTFNITANYCAGGASSVSSESCSPSNGFVYSGSFRMQASNSVANQLAELTIEATPGGYTTPSVGSHLYPTGANVPLVANAFNNYVFTGWQCSGTGCYSGTAASANVILDNSVVEQAIFEPQSMSYAYCIGGYGPNFGSTGATNSVYQLVSTPTNIIQSWNNQVPFPMNTMWTQCDAVSNDIYCMGELQYSSFPTEQPFNYVYYSPISSNGNLGTWSLTANYPTYATGDSCVSKGDYIYCIAGDTWAGSGDTNAVYYSQAGTSGVSGWLSTTPYPLAVDGVSCATYGEYVYCIGGKDSTQAIHPNVYYAKLYPFGVGNWDETTSYPFAVYSEVCTTSGDNIYCSGGADSGGAITDVYYSTINPSGGLGPWYQTTSYPFTTSYGSCVSTFNAIACVSSNDINPTTATYYSYITSNGLSAWVSGANYPITYYVISCVK
ncbi:MAG: hypothetical protein M1504_04175 [Candidatus Marsarchaeota archaeon]|nr:hypothetical protein [Candidatus Marsarchaeota archaeon]